MKNEGKFSHGVLLSHPTGNANLRQVLCMLRENDCLLKLATSIAWDTGSLSHKLLPRFLRDKLSRRQFSIDREDLITNPGPELVRLIANSLNLSKVKESYTVDRIYRALDGKVSRSLEALRPDAVYCYEDGAYETFRSAKRLGIQCYYDLPIAYWKKKQAIMAEEAERLPHWALTLQWNLDSSEKLAKKTEEAELADVIITPSDFVHRSLPVNLLSQKECAVVPFGCPLEHGFKSRKTPDSGPLRVLFVGSMTQRKGLADIFEAFNRLDSRDFELVVMGSLQAPIDFYRKQYRNFTYETPRPHGKVLKLMSECDLFILPSIAEGRALVQLEALSVGLPLIISTNTGGEDLISKDPFTGHIVSIRSPEQITDRLEWFMHNRHKIDTFKENCRAHARSITWEQYRNRLMNLLLRQRP